MATEEETERQARGPPAVTPQKKMGAEGRVRVQRAAYVLLTIGAVVLVNLIGTRVFGRLDLTENHVYTLAPGRRRSSTNLPDY